MQGEDVDYRGVLHRDGSVLMTVSLEQLKVLSAEREKLYTHALKLWHNLMSSTSLWYLPDAGTSI